jgi:hypothetical protein
MVNTGINQGFISFPKNVFALEILGARVVGSTNHKYWHAAVEA